MVGNLASTAYQAVFNDSEVIHSYNFIVGAFTSGDYAGLGAGLNLLWKNVFKVASDEFYKNPVEIPSFAS